VKRRRLLRLLLVLYPRSWRERYADEVADLTDDLLASGETSFLRAAVGLAASGLRERPRGPRRRHRALLLSSGALVILAGTLIVLATQGWNRMGAPSPTRGTVPRSAFNTGRVDMSKIPDYVATAALHVGKAVVVGYIPKGYLFSPGRGRSARFGQREPGGVAPVYASNLKTLIGHEYPSIGFVPISNSPASMPCVPITVADGSTTSSAPCSSSSTVLSNVVGAYTPTGVARLSALGFPVYAVPVHSNSVAPGHIVSMTPEAGSVAYARETVTVDISVSGG